MIVHLLLNLTALAGQYEHDITHCVSVGGFPMFGELPEPSYDTERVIFV